jgi:hypothetical protein
LPEKESLLDAFARASQLLMLSLSTAVRDTRSKDLFDAVKRWVLAARQYLQDLEREHGKAKHKSIEIRSREIEKLLRDLQALTSDSTKG